MQFIQGLGLDAVLVELTRLHDDAPTGADSPAAGHVARSLLAGDWRRDAPAAVRADDVTLGFSPSPSGMPATGETLASSSAVHLRLPGPLDESGQGRSRKAT